MKIFVGTFVHSTWDETLVVMETTALGVENGKIAFICPSNHLDDVMADRGVSDSDLVHLAEGEFFMPGLIDTHIHAPQYVNCGKGLDMPLLAWLNTYTFPTEARFSDLKYADLVYKRVVNRVLRNGTTTACYFATNHLEASLKLCQIVGKYGQRALVGKVCSNQNSPEYYVETTEESLKATERYIEAVRAIKNPLVQPIITPRFAISCDKHLLNGLGDLRRKYDTHVQSHVSENVKECELAQELFPNCDNYVDIYQKSNLLSTKTVLAHGVHLAADEIAILKKSGTGVAHCPNSNISLCSGLCDVRILLDNNIKVGLGTDASGGYHTSMLDAIRHTTQVSNLVSVGNTSPRYSVIDYKEAFRLATLGGAQVLNLDETIGNFEVGKDFDAIRINVTCPDSPIDVFDHDTIQDLVQKFIYLGDDRNIGEVYVSGRKVCDRQTDSDKKTMMNGYVDRSQ